MIQANQQVNELILDSKEIIIMSRLYLNKDYPFNFVTLEDISNFLNVSKNTAINVTRRLEKKGCITKEKGSISFYYPIADKNIRKGVLRKIGFELE